MVLFVSALALFFVFVLSDFVSPFCQTPRVHSFVYSYFSPPGQPPSSLNSLVSQTSPPPASSRISFFFFVPFLSCPFFVPPPRLCLWSPPPALIRVLTRCAPPATRHGPYICLSLFFGLFALLRPTRFFSSRSTRLGKKTKQAALLSFSPM